ncbi:MAG: hypothetical protein DI585_07030, partial [Pseudomonas fluorescens]
MSSRMLKLLGASSAFVAATAASAPYADTISTPLNTTVYTSSTVGPIVVTSTGSIVPPVSFTAIAVSSTNATSNTITIQTGGRITNNYGGSATIVSDDANNAAVTITNAGTISDAAGTGAINLNNMSANNTVTNSGTISGSISLGNGTNTFNSTGTSTGAYNGGSSIDNLNFNNATHTGNITALGGANTVTATTSVISGNYTGGAGADRIMLQNNSVYNGNIELGTGSDVLTVSNARINGNVTSSAGGTGGQTNITLTNAVISGTITDGTTNDNDNLVINGTETFTTRGQIEGMEHVSIQTNTNLNHNLVGAQTVNVANGKVVNVNSNFNTGGLLTNNGTLNINAGHTVGAQSYIGTGGTLGIGINSSDTTVGAGKLALTTGALSAGTSVTINMGQNVGYLTSGTQYVIATGDGVTAAGTAALQTPNTGVYRYSTLVSNTSDVVLNIGRVSTDSVGTTANNKAVGVATDSLATSTNADIVRLQSLIGAQQTEAGVNNVLEALSPGIDGAGAASVNITVDTGNQVSYRLASLRNEGKTGVATGDPMSSNHMWIEGFGSTAEPFVSFDAAFKKAQGYEAQISLRTVTSAQCPMVDFLRQLGRGIDRSPVMQIGAFTMKSGDTLSGSVETDPGKNLDILLIGDDGLVYNLANYTRREGRRASFSLKLESTAASGAPVRPQTVLALVSQSPLPTLSGPNPAPAGDVFPGLHQDIARAGGKVGVG